MIIRKIFYIKTLPNALSFSSVLLWTNASVLFNSCLTSARLGRVQRQAWGMERTPKTKFIFEMSLSGGLPGNYRDTDRVFEFSWVWLVVLFGNGDPKMIPMGPHPTPLLQLFAFLHCSSLASIVIPPTAQRIQATRHSFS